MTAYHTRPSRATRAGRSRGTPRKYNAITTHAQCRAMPRNAASRHARTQLEAEIERAERPASDLSAYEDDLAFRVVDAALYAELEELRLTEDWP